MTDRLTQKRRWYQFGLRLLVWLVVVVALPLGWLSVEMQRAKQRQEAVKAVANAGGQVIYDYHYEWQKGDIVRKKHDDELDLPPSRWLWAVFGEDLFCNVTEVDCSAGNVAGSSFNDQALEFLTVFPDLRTLRLIDSDITDTGLEHLQGLSKLEFLDLAKTQVTDTGLAHVKDLPSLKCLGLNSTQITDSGLDHLKRLTTLEILDLGCTRVTDTGLEQLEGLVNLELLYLNTSDVTYKGVDKLQLALPNCEIYQGS